MLWQAVVNSPEQQLASDNVQCASHISCQSENTDYRSYLSSSPPHSHKVNLKGSDALIRKADVGDIDHLGYEYDEKDGGGCGNHSSTHGDVFPMVSPKL